MPAQLQMELGAVESTGILSAPEPLGAIIGGGLPPSNPHEFLAAGLAMEGQTEAQRLQGGRPLLPREVVDQETVVLKPFNSRLGGMCRLLPGPYQ